MNITKQLNHIFVIPEHNGNQNVIRRVLWCLRFEKDGVVSDAGVETFLDVDNIQNFIPANEVGDDRLLEWVFAAQGGDALIDYLRPHHEEQLKYAKQCAGLETYYTNFNLSTSVPRTTLPSEIL
jgi:hypothetical protein